MNENKESKLIEIEAARNLAIETPVVSSVLGTEHTYQTKASNRQFLNDLITLGIDSKFTCVDMEGNKARVPHTNAQLLVLAEDMQNSITQCFEQFEMLVAQIDSATDQTDFNMIQWS
ncbi:MAG: hypothetical protein GY829_06275 [Gammaproteobacteria bacterium]|nr:hypothetical protein [Gammaproteobacteria bacterium]